MHHLAAHWLGLNFSFHFLQSYRETPHLLQLTECRPWIWTDNMGNFALISFAPMVGRPQERLLFKTYSDQTAPWTTVDLASLQLLNL